MNNVIGISFKENSKIYFFKAEKLSLKEKDKVIVETEKGLQLGNVELVNVRLTSNKSNLKKVVRLATKDDIKKYEKNLKEADESLKKAEKLANKLQLNMRFISANLNFDRSQLLLYFLSDSRIDFRELAKELASQYKTRIELRQIGVRDKAKEVSGLGQCGRELCCANFLKDLDSVSISMAKNQNLALNPNKINGQCGRLLCCLKYEDEQYSELKDGLPTVGKKVKYEKEEYNVVSVDILKRKYTVENSLGNKIDIFVDEK